MPAPKYRSRTFRRVKRRTAKRVVMHYERRKPSQPHCADCGIVLQGIPRLSAAELRSLGKSKKRAARPFGGMLCSSCARRRLIQEARQ